MEVAMTENKPTIVLFVSCRKRAGKDHAASIVHLWRGEHPAIMKFTEQLAEAATFFTNEEKYVPNELGFTKIEIMIAMSRALSALDPDLPVFYAKQAILDELDRGHDVFITDIRRPSEFEWVRSIEGVRVVVVEIRPTELNGTLEDSWITDDVRALWGEDRVVIENDRTSEFDRRCVKAASEIYEV
jgi:hypothetical protein